MDFQGWINKYYPNITEREERLMHDAWRRATHEEILKQIDKQRKELYRIQGIRK
jgi:hypothetical protein